MAVGRRIYEAPDFLKGLFVLCTDLVGHRVILVLTSYGYVLRMGLSIVLELRVVDNKPVNSGRD